MSKIKEIDLIGVVGSDITLDSIKEQMDDVDNYDEVHFNITSPGGSVYEGLDIYEYIKEQDKPTKTIADGQADSIASVILLGGDKREVIEGSEVLIHLPLFNNISGNKNELEEAIEVLKIAEEDIKEVYKKEVEIDETLLDELLENETILTQEQLKEFKFVNKKKHNDFKERLEPIAYVKSDKQNNIEDILDKNNKKFINRIIDFFNGMLNEDTDTKNNMVNMIQLTDVNGGILEFPELEDGNTPEVGNTAVYVTEDEEGNKVETPANGEYIMPENMVYIFEEGELKEIKPLDEEVEEEEVEEEEVVDEVKALTIEEVMEKIDTEVDGEVELVFVVKDGEVTLKEVEVEEEVEETESEEMKALKEEMKAMKADYDKTIREINARIKSDFVPGAVNTETEEVNNEKKTRVIKFKK